MTRARRLHTCSLIVVYSALTSRLVVASEAPTYETVIRANGESLVEQQAELDAQTPGFASVVDIAKQRERGVDDGLGNALARSVGVSLRSAGGLGQYSSVSVRGSSAQQLAVFLDGVPLSGSIGEPYDLTSVTLDVLQTAAVYRGYTPVAFPLAGLGGVVALTTASAKGDIAHVGAAGGSFGTAAGDGHVAFSGVRLGVSGARSSGDYDFYDDGGTPDIPANAHDSKRINNDYRRVTVHATARAELLGAKLSLAEIVLLKEQGIPGPASAQAAHVRLATQVYQTVASLKRSVGRLGELHVALGFAVEARRYRDPDGELSVRSDQRTTNFDLYLAPQLETRLWAGAMAAFAVNVRREHTQVEQQLVTTPTGAARSGDAGRTRDTYGAGLELTQLLGPVRLTGGARLDGVRSDFAVADDAGEYDDRGRNTRAWYVSPRIGAAYRVLDPLELRASVGSYVRVPTLNELFGNRGFVLGNEGLRPEHGWLADVGARLSAETETARGRIETVFFESHVDDLINWQQSGAVLRAVNENGAVLRGIEVAGQGALARELVDAQVAYTLLHSQSRSDATSRQGQQLAGRPRQEVYAELGSTPLREPVKARAFVSADVSEGLNLDPSGRYRVPPRALFGCGVRASWDDFVALSVALQNVFDQRTTTWRPVPDADLRTVPIADFIGYPLPGRALWVGGELHWR